MSYIGNKPIAKNVGVFTPNQQYNLRQRGLWQRRSDPFFGSVVLLLQPESGDSFIVDYSNSNKSITNNGVSLDSNNEKWTGAPSMLFEPSNSDYLVLSDSSDWFFDTSDHTIEGFVKFASSPSGDYGFISQYENGSNKNAYYFNDLGSTNIDDGLRQLTEYGPGDDEKIAEGDGAGYGTSWVHVAITRKDDTFRVFRDGVLKSTNTDSSSLQDLSGSLYIGQFGDDSLYFDGNMTSLRITKGVARYTSNFTPPTRPFPTR
jgi:hypothetical protein